MFANHALRYLVPRNGTYFQGILDITPPKQPAAKEALKWFKDARDAVPLHFYFSPLEGYAAEYGSNVGRIGLA